MKYSLLITLFISFSAIAQSDLINQANKAIANKDLIAAEQICAEDYWNAKESPNGKLRFQELINGQYSLSIEKTLVNDSLAIYTILSSKNGKLQDERLYFYFELSKNGWKIDGINNLVTFHPQYLKGSVEGYFQPHTLPSSPELEMLGKQLLMSSKINNKDISFQVENTQITAEELKLLDSLQLKQTYYSDKLGMGVIEYQYNSPAGPKSLSLYMKKHPVKRNNWEVYNKDYYPPTINIFFLDKSKKK